MTYNQVTFSSNINLDISNRLDKLIEKQKHTLDFLIEYLLATNGRSQLSNCECFIELTAKIRFNLEAVQNILPLLYEDYRFITSSNVLYRAIIDDLINGFYLLGFVVKHDPLQRSLGNELTILHKEFLESAIEGIEAEKKHLEYVNSRIGNHPIVQETDYDYKEEIIKENPEIFLDGKRRNNKLIRETSHQEIKDLLKGM